MASQPSAAPRRARSWALAALALASGRAAARGYDLDACVGKPNYSTLRCPEASVAACWSMDEATSWICLSSQWAPAGGPAAVDALCMMQPTPGGMGRGYFDGACTFGLPRLVPEDDLPVPRLGWQEARSKAKAIVAQMTLAEKGKLMRGRGWVKTQFWYDLKKWWYVGNTAPVPRFGIPSLNLQDAAGGFRTYWPELVGTVTCWPSLLALAATWDPVAVRTFGAALGKEFSGKGANGILGPSVNVHRVARNGRNFEYLSGEDPYLGARLAEAYVRGVQSQGLIAVVKHWIFNEQETNRNSESSNVDPKTAWELYYPPFQAAVDAGIDAVMCSYNRVNGVHSCTSEEQMQTLKQAMGFQGFIQSDWWAAHHTSVIQGLDQDMPGIGPGDFFTKTALADKDQQAVDEAAERILAVIYRANLTGTTKCSPPNCQAWYQQNMTGIEHATLARSLATQSIVLLQNRDGMLPLPTQSKMVIAVVGAAANASVYNPAGEGQGFADAWRTGDYYSGGGSGHVVAGSFVRPLDGIRSRAVAAGMQVIESPSNDIGAAVAAAGKADVTIIVAGTTSGEAADRNDLRLDGAADELIAAVAMVTKNTVVLLQIPGAVLMPWRDTVGAILTLFLGGQETGNAWASVLFGDHAPTGRLPIMMPATERDTIEPGADENVNYAERLATSYRNKNFVAAFPFGHGLTYSTFQYFSATSAGCGDAICVELPIQNTGVVPARTVAQLYLEFPAVAGHPAPFLKGFQTTPVLMPMGTAKASFRLSDRDLSYYDEARPGWVKAEYVTAHIGESASDIRQIVEVATVPKPEPPRPVVPAATAAPTRVPVPPPQPPSPVAPTSHPAGPHGGEPPAAGPEAEQSRSFLGMPPGVPAALVAVAALAALAVYCLRRPRPGFAKQRDEEAESDSGVSDTSGL